MMLPFSQKELQENFRYEDGDLIRTVDQSNTKANTVAGTKTVDGYISIGFKTRIYRAHRLIWYFHNGSVPHMLDHIDGDRSNNRIENLQPITYAENSQKMKDRVTHKAKSGHRGVYRRPDRKRSPWIAKLTCDGKIIQLGCYQTVEEAIKARIAGELKYYKHQPVR